MFSSLWVQHLIQGVQIFSATLSLFFLFGIIYFSLKRKELRKKERERWESHFRVETQDEENETMREWNAIRELFLSPDENNWRVALLKTDTFIEHCIANMFSLDPNLSFAEKLKMLTSSDFPLLDEVWNIHRLRNRIAHERERIHLTQRDSIRTMHSAEEILRTLHCL